MCDNIDKTKEPLKKLNNKMIIAVLVVISVFCSITSFICFNITNLKLEKILSTQTDKIELINKNLTFYVKLSDLKDKIDENQNKTVIPIRTLTGDELVPLFDISFKNNTHLILKNKIAYFVSDADYQIYHQIELKSDLFFTISFVLFLFIFCIVFSLFFSFIGLFDNL